MKLKIKPNTVGDESFTLYWLNEPRILVYKAQEFLLLYTRDDHNFPPLGTDKVPTSIINLLALFKLRLSYHSYTIDFFTVKDGTGTSYSPYEFINRYQQTYDDLPLLPDISNYIDFTIH